MNGRALLLAATLLLGCAGPEARLQPPPAPAPDLAQPPAPPSDPAPAAADAGLPLAAFVERVLAEYRRDPGPLALLPALSDDPRQAPGTQVFATRAGDWIAARTGELLAAAGGVEVWAPDAVERELRRANRSLAAVRRPADLLALLHRAQASYWCAARWRGSRSAAGCAAKCRCASTGGARASPTARWSRACSSRSPTPAAAPACSSCCARPARWRSDRAPAVRAVARRRAALGGARSGAAPGARRPRAPRRRHLRGARRSARRGRCPGHGDPAARRSARDAAAAVPRRRRHRRGRSRGCRTRDRPAPAARCRGVVAAGHRQRRPRRRPHDVRVPIDPMFTTDLDRRLQ